MNRSDVCNLLSWACVMLVLASGVVRADVGNRIYLDVDWGRSDYPRQMYVECQFFEIWATGYRTDDAAKGQYTRVGATNSDYAGSVAQQTWSPGAHQDGPGSESQVLTLSTQKVLGSNLSDTEGNMPTRDKMAGARCRQSEVVNGPEDKGPWQYANAGYTYPGTDLSQPHGDIHFQFHFPEHVRPAIEVPRRQVRFDKHGNNGTVSCSTYCEGSNWPGGTGSCASAIRQDSQQAVACDAVPGLLPGASELTCSCDRWITGRELSGAR